jgi:NADH-quinone oxidoreductase subunit L
LDLGQFAGNGFLQLLLVSSLLVFAGLGLGWWFYGRRPIERASDPDALQRLQPAIFRVLRQGFYVDQLYALTVQRWAWLAAVLSNWMDRWIWSGAPQAVSALIQGLGWIDFSLDRWVVNRGFDQGCNGVAGGGRLLSRLQNGLIQNYLRLMGAGVAILALLLLLGHRG